MKMRELLSELGTTNDPWRFLCVMLENALVKIDSLEEENDALANALTERDEILKQILNNMTKKTSSVYETPVIYCGSFYPGDEGSDWLLAHVKGDEKE